MLEEIRTSLERLIAEYAAIDADQVEIRHEPPTREWIERLTRPTINCYLFDLEENVDLRAPGMHTVRGRNDAVKRFAPRRIDLHFMVSALTTEVADEDALLWRLLPTLLRHAEWPADLVPEEVCRLEMPVATRLEHGPARLTEVWSGLAVRPRPALWYVVTVPLDLEVENRTPLVLTRVTRTREMDTGRETRRALSIAGFVRLADGTAVSDATIAVEGRATGAVKTSADGRFVLRNLAEGTLQLSVAAAKRRRKVVTLQIPGDAYDITLD